LKFSKYHALGNAYIVIGPEQLNDEIPAAMIVNICHKSYGVGADGILFGPLLSSCADFALRIYNPDGSEAEKSGNGLRIFCRYLWDLGLVQDAPFTVETKGGVVRAEVLEHGSSVRVEMGMVTFSSAKIPVVGPMREVLLENIQIDGEDFTFSAVSIGNPHCVIVHQEPSEEVARRFGPLLEVHANFPNRTNVQFMKILDRNNIEIAIWERGAGYAMASGSSSCAAAAVARKLGLCENQIKVHMPGGEIEIVIYENFTITMQGGLLLFVPARCTKIV
jgi:diaminopimelate epimerase